MTPLRIALAGATGNIGREIVRLLEEKDWVAGMPTFLASSVSMGEDIPFRDGEGQVEEMKEYDFSDIDVVIFATNSDVSGVYIPKAIKAGCKVVDLSRLHRADTTVPLVAATVGQLGNKAQISSVANAPALILAPVLAALQEIATIVHATSTALVPTSIAGHMVMDELFTQSASLLGGAGAETIEADELPVQVAYNCLPQVGEFSGENTTAEIGLMLEVNRLLTKPVPITVTEVMVPTFIGVSHSLSVEFTSTIDRDAALAALSKHEAIQIVDNPERGEYSTPYGAAETEFVYVSRVRQDQYKPNAINLWVVGDNMRLAARSAVEAVGSFTE